MWGITALSRRNSRQESHDLIYGQWNMILETMRRVWDIDLTIPVGWALIIPVFPHEEWGQRSHWPSGPCLSLTHLVVHAPFSLCCDPSCDCLTGDGNNHCIVTLAMIIINQSPQLRGVSPLLSSALLCLVTPAPAPVLRTHHQTQAAIHHQMVTTLRCHNSDCLSFKSRHTPKAPTPATSCLSTLDTDPS